MHIRTRHGTRHRRLALLTAAVVLVLYVSSGPTLFDQPYFGLTLHGDRVARVEPGGPADAAGVEPGDLVVAVGGERAAGNPFLGERFYAGALGRTLQVTLASDFGAKHVTLSARPKPVPLRWQETSALVTGIGFLVIGLYVTLQIGTGLATLFFALCTGFSLILLPIAPPEPGAAPTLFAIVRALAALFVPPLTLHFFLLFPRPRRIVQSYRPILTWLYVPAIVALVPLVYVCVAAGVAPDAPGTEMLMMAILRLVTLCFAVYTLLAIASFVMGTFRVRSRAERRRYVVVLWSTVIGIAPLIAGVVIHSLWSNVWMSWEPLTSLGLLLVPLGFAYAIVRHRIFDIEVLVKRSAAFSLLTACLVAIAVVVYLIFGRALESVTGQRTPWIMVVTLAVIAGLFSPLRRRIEGAVDRTFFRDRYDDRRVLRELAQAIPRTLKISELFEEVVEKLTRTLRAREAAIFMPATADAPYRIVYASGLPVEDLDLPPVPPRIQRMITRARRPLRILDVEENLPYGAFDPDEQRLLDIFSGGVIVPFVTGSDLTALLVIGRRAGGESYGFEDMELLGAIAGQATVGIRNAEMHAREVEQARIARELSVAREIQRQLLPAGMPVAATMEFSGGTSPCHEVGGDFYDFLALDDTRLGVAVGDVSGHGVPAALMMASLSGTLRSEAMRERDPGRLLHRLNARACETMEPGHFLSLFYAVLDPRARTIAYANAGHPPPLVLEPGGKVVQLTTGGLLLGVDARARYRSDVTAVRPGSIVLLFSDGLVEAQRNDMEFGEERVVDLVRQNGAGSAAEIRARILESAAAFVDGELQDDVTLIVIRVLD